MAAAGNTLDETIALTTAANTIVQNPNTVGTALKTLSLRIRGVKTELEEAGLETEGMAETTSKLQQQIKALSHGKVDIMIDANTFKSTTQILREMSKAYEDMTDIERAAALELLGGKRQANILSALIENFDIVEDAIQKSENSAGSALKENEKVLDSIQGRINQFNNATQKFWNNLLDSDVIKFFVTLATEVVKLASTFVEVRTAIFGILMYFNMSKKYPVDLAKWIFGKNRIDGILSGLNKVKNALIDINKTKPLSAKVPMADDVVFDTRTAPGLQFTHDSTTDQAKLGAGQEPLNPNKVDASKFASMWSKHIKRLKTSINNVKYDIGQIWQHHTDRMAISIEYTRLQFKRLKTNIGNVFKDIASKPQMIADAISKLFSKFKQLGVTSEQTEVMPADSMTKTQKIIVGVSRIWQNHIIRLKDSINRVKQDFTNIWQHHNERVAQSVQYASNQFTKLKTSATNVFTSMAKMVGNIANNIKANLSRLFTSKGVSSQNQGLASYIGSAQETTKQTNKFSRIWQNHIVRLRDSIGRVKQDFSDIWQHHTERMSASAKYISGQFKNLKAKFGKKPSTALVPTSDVGKNTSTASKIAAEVSRIWKVHIANLKGNYQSIKDTATTVWGHHKIRVKDYVAYTSAQFSKLKGVAQKVTTSMGNIFKNVTAPISKVFNNIVKHASNAFNKIKASASNMAKATKQAFASRLGYQNQSQVDVNNDAQSWTSASPGNQLLSLGDNASVAKQIQDINNAMAQGEVALNNYMSGLGNTDNALKAYIASLNGGKASLSGFHQFIQTHNAGLKASGVAARLAAVGHTILNAALSMGLSVLIQFAMEGLGKLIEYLKGVINPTEKLAGELSDLRSEISDIENKIDSLNSELETTKDRIAELTALPSLSFMEQEELKKLKSYNDELERNIKLEEVNLKTKNDAEVAKAEEYIKEAWNQQGMYYVNAHGEIKDDSGWSGFWNNSVKTTDAIDKAITKYQSRQEDIDALKNILTQWDDMSKSERNDFRHTTLNNVSTISSDYDSSTIKRRIEEEETKNKNILNSINDILNDESYSGLSYGMSESVNKFLDERYAYQLKVQQLQGESIKSDAISSLFDNTSTKQLQSLGKKLQDIVRQDVDESDNAITDEEKREAILKEIDAINEEADAYNRLNLAMDIVGVTAKDIADYFVLETGRYDSSTIEGVTAQYTDALAVMKELQGSRGGDFEIDGQRYGWTAFFDRENGKFKANAEEFAKILKGMDEECRNTFMSLVESVRNGELNWNQAIESLSHSGSLAGLKLVSEQLSAINSVTFTSVKDEISGVIDTFEEFGAALEDVASSMDLLKVAQVQMNNAGRLSVKTALEIISSTDRWNEVLDISNGQITLQSNATEVLVQDKLDLIKANIQNEIATLEEQISIIESQDASHSLAMTIEESTNVAIRDMAGNMAYLTEVMKAYALIANGQDPGDFIAAAEAAKETAKNGIEVNYKLNQANAAGTANLEKQLADANARLKMMEQIDTEDEYKKYYDFEKHPGDKYDSNNNGVDDDIDDAISNAWEKLLKKYENKLALITNQRDLIQAEIDQMEATGAKASHQYYKDLIDNSNAEKQLLIEKRDELQKYLDANEHLMDQDTWTEMNNEINDVKVAIQECTVNLLEYYDAMEEIDAHYFEQTTDDISRLGEEIQFVQGLLENDKVADENGNWTNEGITQLGLYVNEMERAAASAELYKKELGNVEESYKQYHKLFENAEDINGDGVLTVEDIDSDKLTELYNKYGYVITSAEEYKEKTDELTDSMYSEIEAYESAKNGIVELNEARVDAIRDGVEKEIEAYEELIKLKQEELSAERD